SDPRPLRERGRSLPRHRPALGRRHHRPRPDPRCAGAGAVGRAERSDPRDALRRLQDVGSGMNRDRLTAFTDGVLAVIITIMVLELKPPQGVAFQDLVGLWPGCLSYVLSFAYVAIYWSNHHHFFQ